MSLQDPGYIAAVEEQKAGEAEGGMPVGSAVVDASGRILGRGRNMTVQNGSVILHGETAAFDAAGKAFPIADMQGGTLYTTLSPCPMCAGSAVFFKVARVVIAENKNFTGNEEFLRAKGIEVVILDDEECARRMSKFITEQGGKWNAAIPS